MQTTELTMTLDGTTFRGRVRRSTNETSSQRGSEVRTRERRVFDAKVAQSIFVHKLCGPEAFKFCRLFCAMSVETVAGLLQVDSGTVERWENKESETPAWAMLLVSKIGEESSRGRTSTHTWLRQLADDTGRPTEIDLETLRSATLEG